jgi:hypothetical protein
MGSFLNKALMPLVLVGCLWYVYGQSDLDTPEPLAPPFSDTPVAGSYPRPAGPAIRLEAEPLLQFGGYPCNDNCSEHLAGYQWAQENGISEPDNCDGRSAQFIEGCRVYAEQRRVDVAMSK